MRKPTISKWIWSVSGHLWRSGEPWLNHGAYGRDRLDSSRFFLLFLAASDLGFVRKTKIPFRNKTNMGMGTREANGAEAVQYGKVPRGKAFL